MKKTILKVTGTTGGSSPIVDSVSRGLILSVLEAILAFVANKTGILTQEDIGTLQPVIILLSFVFWGLWDKFIKLGEAQNDQS